MVYTKRPFVTLFGYLVTPINPPDRVRQSADFLSCKAEIENIDSEHDCFELLMSYLFAYGSPKQAWSYSQVDTWAFNFLITLHFSVLKFPHRKGFVRSLEIIGSCLTEQQYALLISPNQRRVPLLIYDKICINLQYDRIQIRKRLLSDLTWTEYIEMILYEKDRVYLGSWITYVSRY